MRRAQVLVAGGGIGGLATALALARRGHGVEVLEQAGVFGEIGAGIQLGPNVTRRLQSLGLNPELDSIVARPWGLTVHDAHDGTTLARLPLGDAFERHYGAWYACVHRADLHELLRAAAQAEGVALTCRAQITQVVEGGDAVCVSSDDARAWEGDALIGADGLWSVVRQHVVENDEPPRATGHIAWRAMVRQDALPQTLRRHNVDVWLGARLHAVAYPVRGGDWLNFVVIAEPVSPARTSPLDQRAWDQAASLDALQQATGRCCSDLQLLLEAMPRWRAWSLHDREPLTGAHQMAQERIALVGDAAHPMLPYLAQGAGMAIEDAVALADALDEGTASAIPVAFARYAQARWERNARVQARARRNGGIFHATGLVRSGRDLAMRALGARLLDVPWLYGG